MWRTEQPIKTQRDLPECSVHYHVKKSLKTANNEEQIYSQESKFISNIPKRLFTFVEMHILKLKDFASHGLPQRSIL